MNQTRQPETIEVTNLSKTFGSVQAVTDLTFSVNPGRVTGFLGPNGAGKTTTLRMLLGLVKPTSGTATISGRVYSDLAAPLNVVGAALEAASFHPGRTAIEHLRAYAPAAGASDARCAELLDLVGLSDVAKRRVGGFSLGMRQRLALATTLLGDPSVLLLDEPANGLDPAGIVWLRSLLRHLASEGRTVLVSSHMLSEVQQSVDDVVIISRGRLAHASTLSELSTLAEPTVTITSPSAAKLERLITSAGWSRTPADHVATRTETGPTTAHLAHVTAQEVGAQAFAAGVEIHELSTHGGDLESLFLSLVEDDAPSPASPHSPASPTPGGLATGQETAR